MLFARSLYRSFSSRPSPQVSYGDLVHRIHNISNEFSSIRSNYPFPVLSEPNLRKDAVFPSRLAIPPTTTILPNFFYPLGARCLLRRRVRHQSSQCRAASHPSSKVRARHSLSVTNHLQRVANCVMLRRSDSPQRPQNHGAREVRKSF